MASCLLRCNSPFLHPQISSNTTTFPQSHKIQIPTKSLRSPISCKLTSPSSSKNPTKKPNPNPQYQIHADITGKTLLGFAKRAKDSEKALAVIEWISNKDWYVPLPHVYEFMIARLGHERQFDRMREALAIMASTISKPTVEAFLNMIKSYAMANMLNEAVGVLTEMEEMGVEPTTKCYSILLGLLLNENKVEMVEELYSRMRDGGVKPDVETFNAVIGARCWTNQLDSAMGFLEEMREHGLVPNKLTFSILMDGFIQDGRRNNVWELYEKMVSLRAAN